MTTTFLLIRHGHHDLLGKVLCGRMDGVPLSGEGRAQAADLAARLSREPIAAVYTSPLQRAQETAAPLAERLGLRVETAAAFTELDFGEWTGAALDALPRDPRWGPWCGDRGLHRPPGGESMGEAQARAVRAVEAIRERHPDQTVAVVSHADVIKALLCWWLGLALDFYRRFDVDPGSTSVAVNGSWGARVVRINEGARP